MRDLPARPFLGRPTRLLAALIVAIGLAWVPITTVDAAIVSLVAFRRSGPR